MSIWIVVVFIVLTIVGIAMVAIGLHEKTKHKDDPTGKPGKTYDILLYAGIALAVIGIIGLIWSMISYVKSKKSVQVNMGPDMGPPQGMMGPDMGPPQGMYGPPSGPDYGIEMTSMSQGPPQFQGYNSPPVGAGMPQFVTLPDGRIYNVTTNTVIPSANSVMTPSVVSQSSSVGANALTLEDIMKSAKLFKELKDIIG